MGLFRYLLQYRVRDMADFLRNEKKDPRDFDGDLRGKTALITGRNNFV